MLSSFDLMVCNNRKEVHFLIQFPHADSVVNNWIKGLSNIQEVISRYMYVSTSSKFVTKRVKRFDIYFLGSQMSFISLRLRMSKMDMSTIVMLIKL